MCDPSKIVTVDVNLAPPSFPEHQVLFNLPKEAVLDIAEKNEKEKILTIPFYTGPVGDVPDWSDFLEYPYNYLLKPIYIGNLNPVGVAIDEMERILFSL